MGEKEEGEKKDRNDDNARENLPSGAKGQEVNRQMAHLLLARLSSLRTGAAAATLPICRVLAAQRSVHAAPLALKKVVPFNLADIGEGIAQATVLEW